MQLDGAPPGRKQQQHGFHRLRGHGALSLDKKAAMEIMTPRWGIRSRAEGFPRAVAHVAAAVLAVTAMLAAMWAGPLAAASAGTRPRAAVQSPAPAPAPASAPASASASASASVKFYIVPPPGNGPADSLFTIAAKTLGDGGQFTEIFNLNKGRLQPNGGRLTNPQLIEPGWILQLPAAAAGPGVHFGPLPGVTAPVPHRPSGPAGTGSAAMIGGAVLAFLAAGLAFWLIRRRAGPTRRRRPAHARAPGRAGRAPRPGPPAVSAEPVTRPAKPSAKPAGRPRQVRAMRLTALTMTVPILFGLISATGELARHGYGFFVFRSAGTGATQPGPSGPAPSQPSAAHHPHRIGSGLADPQEVRKQQDQEGHDP
jgi:hypothetical protein